MTKTQRVAAQQDGGEETQRPPMVHFVIDEAAEKKWRAREFGNLSPVAIGVVLGNMVSEGKLQPADACPKCDGRIHVNVDGNLLTQVAEKHKQYLDSKPVPVDEAKEALTQLEKALYGHRKGCPRLSLTSFVAQADQFKKEIFGLTFGVGEKEVDGRPLYEQIVAADAALSEAVANHLKEACEDLTSDPELEKSHGAEGKRKVEEDIAHAMNLSSVHQRVQALYDIRRKLRDVGGLRYCEQRTANRVANEAVRALPSTPRGKTSVEYKKSKRFHGNERDETLNRRYR